MKRRDFLAATALAGTAPLAGFAAPLMDSAAAGQQCLELRTYHQNLGPKRGVLNNYLKDVAIPAWNKIGIGPVGVFSVTHGENGPTLYVLLPHPNVESVLTANTRLLDNADYQKAAAEFINTPMAEPAFVRMESQLMLAFKGMPQVEAPVDPKTEKGRLFELRIYESHNETMAKRKIHMFNEGGEIDIFRKTGLNPVFFGETIVGKRMPNLTYMVGFKDWAAREKAWDDFRNAPAWKELSAKEFYKDTVSNITDLILAPTGYSQI